MPTFVQTPNPTPYGFFDSDAVFAYEADNAFTFVRRKLGDDIVTVELTKKQIWAALEESYLEYGKITGQQQISSQLASLLGIQQAYSGSIVNGQVSSSFSMTGLYPQVSLDSMMRQADAVAAYTGLGGNYDTYFTYLNLVPGKQDYDIYTDMLRADGPLSGSSFFQTVPSQSLDQKIRVFEVFHFEPLAAQHYLLNASNITNFLASEFNYESYVNTTVFYVLPVYEDILRRGMLETAHRVRRSHYTYRIQGSNFRVYPIPSSGSLLTVEDRIYLRVGLNFDNSTAINPAYAPYGYLSNGGTVAQNAAIATPGQVPITIVPPTTINEVGRQWCRQYCVALCKEMLGLVRNKFKSVPIPGADLQLNGDDLVSQGREDQTRLRDQFVEWLNSLTYQNLIAQQADTSEALLRFLRLQPMPIGNAISIK